MAVELITGLGTEEHIEAEDVGGFQAGLTGNGDYCLQAGNNGDAEISASTTVVIKDGEFVMQGRHWRIKPGTTESVTIENGAIGETRKDLIVGRYEKAGGTGVESVTIKVLKGKSGSSTAENPTTGNLRNGDTVHEMPLYLVDVDGYAIKKIEKQFKILRGIESIDSDAYEGKTKATALEKEIKGMPDKILNIHVWEKFGLSGEVKLGEEEDISLGSYASTIGAKVSVRYSDNVGVLEGKISLSEPISAVAKTPSNSLSVLNVLRGKYIRWVNQYDESAPEKCYRVTDTATFEESTVVTPIISIRCNNAQEVLFSSYSPKYGFVTSEDQSAYPKNGNQNGYHYEYRGTIGQALTKINTPQQ